MKITTLTNPRQTILLTTRFKEKNNIMTLDWHMPLSFDPMIFAVSVGKARYSLELIRASKSFVVNFMSNDFEKEILYCGTHSGKNIDKFEKTSLEKEEAESINAPRIKQSLAYLECEVMQEIETGDHILFIGEVSKAEFKEKGKRLFHIFGDNFTTTID